MPIDETDKQLLKGAIWFVVILVVALFLPGYGYLAEMEKEGTIRDTLRTETNKQFAPFYGSIPPPYYGELSGEADEQPVGVRLEKLKQDYENRNREIDQLIKAREEKSRMSFPEWTETPPPSKVQPGVYFDQIFLKHRVDIAEKCRAAQVRCDDQDIGFKKYSGLTLEEKKAKEYLRELFIAEKIISLCITAKQQQKENEIMVKKVQPEAFMHIISVEPQTSVPSGPAMLAPNPKYSEDAAKNNPTSEKAKPFLIIPGKVFIQEYPVEIVLQCDINSFMRFLHSVRTKDQFLVIRSLEIVSPSLQDSEYSKTELTELMGKLNSDTNKSDVNKDEYVFVKMSAAGMDFFDSDKYPNGIYSTDDARSRTPQLHVPTKQP